MAQYKYNTALHHHTSTEFDKLHTPGAIAPLSGIYRCTGCGDEISIAKGHILPPQNHHQHPNVLIPIRWQLIVCAQTAV